MTNNHPLFTFASRVRNPRSVAAIVAMLALTWSGFLPSASYAATTPKPSTSAVAAKPPATAVTAACKKVYKEIVNADNIYVATQYGVIAAAKSYIASGTLINKLSYNQSFITVFKAANAELNIALKNSKCYPAASVKTYLAGVKSNLNQISTIQTYNINGQLYYDVKKASVIKPVGLLK